MNVVNSDGQRASDNTVVQPAPVVPITDRLKPRQTGTGAMRGQQTIVADNNAKLVMGNVPDTQNAFGETFYDSTGTRRMLFGTYPDGEVKAKLSQPSYDVLTATDAQLIWSSDFNTFKITDKPSYTFPAIASVGAFASEYQYASFPHNLLNRVPAFLVYARLPKSTEPQFNNFPPFYYTPIESQFGSVDSTSTSIFNLFYVGVDETSIYVSRESTNGDAVAHAASEISIVIYILSETAN